MTNRSLVTNDNITQNLNKFFFEEKERNNIKKRKHHTEQNDHDN